MRSQAWAGVCALTTVATCDAPAVWPAVHLHAPCPGARRSPPPQHRNPSARPLRERGGGARLRRFSEHGLSLQHGPAASPCPHSPPSDPVTATLPGPTAPEEGISRPLCFWTSGDAETGVPLPGGSRERFHQFRGKEGKRGVCPGVGSRAGDLGLGGEGLGGGEKRAQGGSQGCELGSSGLSEGHRDGIKFHFN